VIRSGKETVGRRGDASIPTRSCTSTCSRSSSARLGNRASSLSLIALPRDPGLPPEGCAQGGPHRAPAQLLLSRAPVPDSRAARHGGWASGPGHPGSLDALLQELTCSTREMGQRAITDYDEETTTTTRSPTSSRARASRLLPVEKDWHYRKRSGAGSRSTTSRPGYRCAFREGRVVQGEVPHPLIRGGHGLSRSGRHGTQGLAAPALGE